MRDLADEVKHRGLLRFTAEQKALVKYPSGEARRAELHWFEAHGIGKKEIKVKRPL